MDLHVEPGFQHKLSEPRWFVRTLTAIDVGYRKGNRFQVQFLDEDERGTAVLEFAHDETSFDVLRLELPQAVIDAAIGGVNGYVDAHGARCLPGFLGRNDA